MSQSAIRPLSKILGIDVIVNIVDVGANPIDGNPPYKALLARKGARLIGFEPNSDALAKLKRKKGPNETYLPHAVGDGQTHTLNLCQASGMSSLLTPNQALYKYFHGFSDWARIVRTEQVKTIRLDDVPQVKRLDFLKIDIQGGELMVFQNAPNRLKDCLVIQTEVEFLPLYENQPLFSEVEQFLRGRGFILHRFWPQPFTRALKPMVVEGNIARGLSQVVDADAIFMRDFMAFDQLDAGQLLRMATILHDVYQSLDVVLRLLIEHDRRLGTRYASTYMGQDVPLE
ncbi:methyltransferase FkbM [Paramagnetospirillum kuznetsovii]|uniref:Methyltransferase FkbM n=1 Tax=Paramagnetospirillum kuznetsovii TaxID=2053833 RepID=A0A364P2A1_9PROT|nr:FkbM family methyltransferase [Paramagnetospirillum kuznetsovii]RAU23479.1 methyltransferase FkbM [Paramagnetospirillum kuznetsovii]